MGMLGLERAEREYRAELSKAEVRVRQFNRSPEEIDKLRDLESRTRNVMIKLR